MVAVRLCGLCVVCGVCMRGLCCVSGRVVCLVVWRVCLVVSCACLVFVRGWNVCVWLFRDFFGDRFSKFFFF